MGQRDLMYTLNSGLIAGLLLILMLTGLFLGYRLARRRRTRDGEETRNQTSAVQGSLLGFLALLLGFTFSLALSRYDDRSRSVVAEANAIGTAYLRADLLPDTDRDGARDLLRRYLAVRVAAGQVSADAEARRDRLIGAAQVLFNEVWRLATTTAKAQGGPVTLSFVTSLNDMSDALGDRDAAVERHVPELVLSMLFATLVLTAGVLGYWSGLSGVKPRLPVYLMLVLIVLLVFIIIDLDRPRRGFIAVDQSPMTALLAQMQGN